jgi:hypothetical protein
MLIIINSTHDYIQCSLQHNSVFRRSNWGSSMWMSHWSDFCIFQILEGKGTCNETSYQIFMNVNRAYDSTTSSKNVLCNKVIELRAYVGFPCQFSFHKLLILINHPTIRRCIVFIHGVSLNTQLNLKPISR